MFNMVQSLFISHLSYRRVVKLFLSMFAIKKLLYNCKPTNVASHVPAPCTTEISVKRARHTINTWFYLFCFSRGQILVTCIHFYRDLMMQNVLSNRSNKMSFSCQAGNLSEYVLTICFCHSSGVAFEEFPFLLEVFPVPFSSTSPSFLHIVVPLSIVPPCVWMLATYQKLAWHLPGISF